MGNFVFYRDSAKTFECDIKIQGASTNSTRARLTLEFSDRTLLFNGDIRDGHVSVVVPKLPEISESAGNATLEIIADQTFFEAWKSPIQLMNKKSVFVSEVKVHDSKSKIVVENVNQDVPRVTKTPETTGIYKGGCSVANRKFVKESFNRFESMDSGQKKIVKESLREFRAKPTIKAWAETVFTDTNTPYAKYCMYALQIGSKKRL